MCGGSSGGPDRWRLVVRCAAVPAAWLMVSGALLAQGLPSKECVTVMRHARIAHMLDDTTLELATLRGAVERFPGEVAPLFALLEAHREHTLPDGEIAGFRAMLSTRLADPTNRLPASALGGAIADPAADTETLELLEDYLATRLAEGPEDEVDVLRALVSVQKRLADIEGAARSLARLRELVPSEGVSWELYQVHLELERWDEAIEVFEELMTKTEDESMAKIYVRLLGRAGRTEEQRQQIEKSLANPALNPAAAEWKGTLTASAWDLRDAGKDKEAEALFELAARIEPQSVAARARLVHLYGSEAERSLLVRLEASLLQEEEDPAKLLDAGTEKLAAGDAQGAVELLRRATAALPDLEAAWYNLGMAAYQTEEWLTSASAFERAAQINPERAESFFFAGMSHHNLSRCPESVAALEKSLTLEIGRQVVHYYLASCYKTLGNEEAAVRHSRLYAEAVGQ